MNVMAGLEKRLEESEQQLTGLLQHLERQDSLEKLLNDAGRGIGEASSNLGDLAVSNKAILESLKSVVDSLQEAVGILVRSNPAETVEAVARIGKQLEVTLENVSAKQSKETAEAVARIEKQLGVTLEKISVQQRKSSSRAMRISVITLIVVLVALGIEVLRFFQ